MIEVVTSGAVRRAEL